MNLLPNGIYSLEYNEIQRCFHFNNTISDNNKTNDWEKLKAMSESECIEFTSFMDKKYNDGRKSGILPESKVVKIELELFFALKESKRKLSGR